MYKIYVNKTLIYHGASEKLHITNGRITHELNKSSTFDFTILQDHPYYDKFQRLKDIVTVYSDDTIKFRGRILEDKSDFRNNKNIKCEGELSFLTDILIRPYAFTGTPEELFKKFINDYNAQADASRQFVVGRVTVTDPNDYIVRSSSEVKDAWTNIKDKLIDMLGGYVYISGYDESGKAIINYFADMPYICKQTIKFGENLLDFARGNTASNIGTVLIPYGAKIEGSDTRITIESANNGLDYIVDEEALAKYGRIERTNTWDDVTEPSNLLRKAKAYLASIILTNITLELSAVDLSLLDSSMDQFNYGCYIPIKSAPHNVDALFLLCKQSIDLLRPDNDKITLGATRNSFTGESLNSTANMVEKIVSDYKANDAIITELVNGITVGGRNLLKYTDDLPITTSRGIDGISNYSPKYGSLVATEHGIKYTYGSNNQCGITVPLIFDGCIENGETLTLSFTYRGNITSPGQLYLLQRTTPNVSVNLYKHGALVANETEWQHFTATFSMAEANARVCYQLLFLYTLELYTTDNWIEIKHNSLKLEKGNKATDWSPATEDVVTDYTQAIESLRGSLISSIEQTSEGILTTVGEQYFTKDEGATLVSDVNTQFQQTKDSFEMSFNKFQVDLETLNSSTNTEFEEIKKYIRFENGNIVLGQVGNELTLKITNEKISFLQAGNEVAYFSNQKLYITDAEALNSLQVGKFAFIPRANGSLDFKKVG